MDRSNKVLEVVALISNWGINCHMGEKDKVYDPKQTDVFTEQRSTHVSAQRTLDMCGQLTQNTALN